MKVARANPSTTQTNTALIPARSGRYVNVLGVYISSDTEMEVSLVNSDTHDVVWKQYVGGNGGSFAGDGNQPLTNSALGEGLDYSTSTNGNVFISVNWKYNAN